jgi:hypothetical protein
LLKPWITKTKWFQNKFELSLREFQSSFEKRPFFKNILIKQKSFYPFYQNNLSIQKVSCKLLSKALLSKSFLKNLVCKLKT